MTANFGSQSRSRHCAVLADESVGFAEDCVVMMAEAMGLAESVNSFTVQS